MNIGIKEGRLQKAQTKKGLVKKQKLKVLFLANPFPPFISPGCIRTWNIAKYLARFGWDVNVVTPHPTIWRNIESPGKWEKAIENEGIQRIFTAHHWRCLFDAKMNYWNHGLGWMVGGICRKVAQCLDIDNGIGWIKPVENACSLLTRNDVDIIFATGAPFSSFKIAYRLSKRLKCPYVLDYRDPWTANPHIEGPTSTSMIREEALLLENCSGVSIVSNSWKADMERRFNISKKIHTVSNGFDPEEFADVEPEDFGHFAIVYAGTFYPPKRVISPLMAALKRLKEEENFDFSDNWYFHYYGPEESHILQEGARFGVKDQIIVHGTVPRRKVLSVIKGANVVVIITSISENATLDEAGIVPSKLFETIGLEAPILLVAPPNSDVRQIVKKTELGECFAGDEIEKIVEFLKKTMSGPVQNTVNGNLAEFSWPKIVSKLNRVFLDAVG